MMKINEILVSFFPRRLFALSLLKYKSELCPKLIAVEKVVFIMLIKYLKFIIVSTNKYASTLKHIVIHL